MATYKLLQDIEAEDHILGPLTLREFIFALVATFFYYICFIIVTKLHATFMLALFLPPALFCTFFAMPFGRDQPTEIWALAKLRFWFKPRVRVWNQTGIKEMVTITVPKRVEPVLTNGLSETEVQSRLKALANTIDSRGWAIKNINTFGPPRAGDSDRLIDISGLPLQVPADGTTSADDMMATANPVARQFDTLINEASQAYRQRLIDQLSGMRQEQAATQVNNDWFMKQPEPPSAASVPAAQDDPGLARQLKDRAPRATPYGNLRTLQPLGARKAAAPMPSTPVTKPVTAQSNPAILSLANNNDLNVATLAREAQKAKGGVSQNEVTISLH